MISRSEYVRRFCIAEAFKASRDNAAMAIHSCLMTESSPQPITLGDELLNEYLKQLAEAAGEQQSELIDTWTEWWFWRSKPASAKCVVAGKETTVRNAHDLYDVIQMYNEQLSE